MKLASPSGVKVAPVFFIVDGVGVNVIMFYIFQEAKVQQII